MKLSALFQQPAEVLEKWDSLLKEFPLNTQFRKEYLEYRMGLYSFFTISDIEQVFQEAIYDLTEVKLKQGQNNCPAWFYI